MPHKRKTRNELLCEAIEEGNEANILLYVLQGAWGNILFHDKVLKNVSLLQKLYDLAPDKFNESLKNPDPDIHGENYTPLLRAAFKGYNDSVKFLIEKGANIVTINNGIGITILHSPFVLMDLPLLKWMFARKPVKSLKILDAKANDKTPLLVAMEVSFEAIIFLVKQGADIAACDKFNQTIFCSKLVLESLNHILQIHDINPEKFDVAFKASPIEKMLDIAAKSKFHETVEFIANYVGCSYINNNRDTILHKPKLLAIYPHLISLLHDINPKIFAETVDKLKDIGFGRTPLRLALEELSDLPLVSELLLITDLLIYGANPIALKYASRDRGISTSTKNLFLVLHDIILFVDNILKKCENSLLVEVAQAIMIKSSKDEDDLNLTNLIMEGRIKNKWKDEGCDAELPPYIINCSLIPQELKLMLIASPETLAYLKSLESGNTISSSKIVTATSTDIYDKEESISVDRLEVAVPLVELSLSEMVTKSAWARREAAVKAFGAKWHDIIAIREANARAEAERLREETHEGGAANNFAEDIDMTTVSTSCLGIVSLSTAIDS